MTSDQAQSHGTTAASTDGHRDEVRRIHHRNKSLIATSPLAWIAKLAQRRTQPAQFNHSTGELP